MIQLQKKKTFTRVISFLLLFCLLFSNTAVVRAESEVADPAEMAAEAEVSADAGTEADSVASAAADTADSGAASETTDQTTDAAAQDGTSGNANSADAVDAADTAAGTSDNASGADATDEDGGIMLMGVGDEDEVDGDSEEEDDTTGNDTDVTDLTQYIKRITFFDKDKNTVDPDTYKFKNGEEIQIGFNWTIPGDIYKNHKEYTYQLPKVIAIDEAVTGPVMQGSERVGTFRIDEDLKVTITYYDTYNTENNTIPNVMTVKGTAVYLPDDSKEEKEFSYKDGSETIVVVNDGDFTVKKAGSVSYENNQMSDSSKITYTVTIASSLGTYGDFTVTDALTKSSNIKSAVYDEDSFTIKDADGNPVTGWSLELSESGFVITGLPALPYNGTYTLTYDVDVAMKAGTNTKETIKNTVTAANEKTNHSYENTITYDYKVTKSFYSYNRRTQQVTWHVDLITSGTDMTGFVIEDINDYPILPETAKLVAYNSSWQAQATYTADTGLDITFGDDNKTVKVIVPDADDSVKANTTYWQLTYKSQLTFPEGVTSITTTNKAIITTPEDDPEKWEVSRTGTGTDEGTAVPTKSANGIDASNTAADYIIANWGLDISYTGISDNYVSVYDKIASAGVYYQKSSSTGYDTSSFATDHYAIASELMEQFLNPKNGLIITVINDDETTTDLTLNEAIAQNYRFSFTFYQTNDYTSPESYPKVDEGDSTTHVRSFKIEVKAPSGESTLKVSRIRIGNYTTRLLKEHITEGSIWRVGNQIRSLDTYSDTVYQKYQTKSPTIAKLVNATDSSGTSYWTDKNVAMDYDTIEGVLRYRIIVTVPEGQDSITITDQLPDGVHLAFDASTYDNFGWGYTETNGVSMSKWIGPFAVGPYTGSVIIRSYSEGWTTTNRRENISLVFPSEGNNTFSVTINNIGTKLQLTSSRQIAIDFEVTVDDISELTGTETETDGNASVISKTITNTASVGELETSISTELTRTTETISKSGYQVTEDGAYTSTVHYEIVVNPYGDDLLEASDTIELTDTITSENLTFALDRSSIKLYRMNADGTKGEEEEIQELEISEAAEDASGTMTQSFTMKVKDATAYIVAYDYVVDSAKSGTKGSLSNEAEIYGVAKDSEDIGMKGVTASASSDNGALKVYKIDSRNQAKYLSAEFKLEKYDMDSDSFQTVAIDGSDTFTVEKEGYAFDYFGSKGVLEGNTLYRIVETKQPDGYYLSDRQFYFIIKGNIEEVRKTQDLTVLETSTDTEAEMQAYGGRAVLGKGDDAVSVSDISIDLLEAQTTRELYIQNEEILLTLNIEKVDANDTSEQLDGATFALWMPDDEAEEMIPYTEIHGTIVGTGKTDKDGSLSFTNLKPGTYYAVETESPAGYKPLEKAIPLTMDGYNIKLTDEDVEDVASVSSTDSRTVYNLQVKNKAYPLIQMPEAGSTASGMVLLFGFAAMAAGLFYFRRRKWARCVRQ